MCVANPYKRSTVSVSIIAQGARTQSARTLPELGDRGPVLAQVLPRQALSLLRPLIVAHHLVRVLQHELAHAGALHELLQLLVGRVLVAAHGCVV